MRLPELRQGTGFAKYDSLLAPRAAASVRNAALCQHCFEGMNHTAARPVLWQETAGQLLWVCLCVLSPNCLSFMFSRCSLAHRDVVANTRADEPLDLCQHMKCKASQPCTSGG
jgi:hypothetical protein